MCERCDDLSHLGPAPTRREFMNQAATVGMAAMLAPLAGGSAFAQEAGGIPSVGYGKSSSDAPLAPVRFTRDALKADEVLIDILYCGVCHTDIHFAERPIDYLLVPGHEIVGRVSRVGTSVSRLKVGDAVGVGPVLDSCGQCESCRAGLQQYCNNPGFVFTSGRGLFGGKIHYGGYSNNIAVKQDYAIRIPDRMNLAAAAPLLCAGITTWSPIKAWGAGAGSKVGVIGMGGLGHLAVKFLKDAGADVTLFTTTPGKTADARRFGANEVVTFGDMPAYERLSGQFDLILSTLPVASDMRPFVNMLARDGTLLDIGLEGAEPPLPSVMLALQRRRFASSFVGGIPETQAMMDYCATKGIAADVEIIPIAQVNTAWERIKAKDVRYRFVIDMATLQA